MLLALLLVASQAIDHSGFTSVLARHATADGVRYAALKADRAGLDAYIKLLSTVSASDFDRWSRSEQIAYLINAYNAVVLQQVVDHYPIKRSLNPAALIRPANSVWQISGFFSELKHRVAGRDLTLDDIEHRWLRERLKEPRIHAALVCAAQSCPPLRPEAYSADRLSAQLDDQMSRFLSDRSKNRFDASRRSAEVSEIFKWFGEDFDDLPAFLARYVPAHASWLRSAKLSYIDYNWALNDAR